MKKNTKIIITALLLIVIVISLTGCQKTVNKQEPKGEERLNIVTSFYPIYIMLGNIIDGIPGIHLENMTDSQTGCLHDYTLRTQDLIKIEKADVLIENGLGIETFNDKILKLYPNLKVIDSSVHIQNLIKEKEVNPHIWTSTENYIQQVRTIAEELGKVDKQNTEVYKKNAEKYIEDIMKKQQNYNNSQTIKAITFSEAFEYFAEENNITLISVKTQHEESALSAEQIANIVEQIKQEDIKIILVDKDENQKNAQLIATETGAIIYSLDSYLRGEENKNAYLQALGENLETVKHIREGLK